MLGFLVMLLTGSGQLAALPLDKKSRSYKFKRHDEPGSVDTAGAPVKTLIYLDLRRKFPVRSRNEESQRLPLPYVAGWSLGKPTVKLCSVPASTLFRRILSVVVDGCQGIFAGVLGGSGRCDA